MLDCYVFFDVDDTLVEWSVSWREVFARVAAEAGAETTAEQAEQALTTAFTTFYGDTIRRYARGGDLREFWVDYDGRILALLGVKGDLRRHAERVVDQLQRPENIRLYPEARETLERLAGAGARLGIVTGRPQAGPDLERLGVLHYFEPVIDAFGAAGIKAEGEMFARAARRAAECGCPAWHVGDHYDDDVRAASKAGLRPVLVDRRNAHPKADCPRITDLRQLLEIVGE